MIKDFVLKHKFAFAFFSGFLTLSILVFIVGFLFVNGRMGIWESYQTNIPETQNHLIFYWKTIHPFLAEYDRKVQITVGDRKSKKYWLVKNTGGRHHLNLYLLEIDNEKWLRILDEYAEAVFNLNNLQGFSVGRKFGKTFLGPLEEDAYWEYSWLNNNIEALEASAAGQKGVYDPSFEKLGKFIGTLDARKGQLRFIAASEKPEEQIKTQDELAGEEDKKVEQFH